MSGTILLLFPLPVTFIMAGLSRGGSVLGMQAIVVKPPFIAARVPGLATVLPTVPHIAARVRAATAAWPTPLTIVESEDEKFAAFDAADALGGKLHEDREPGEMIGGTPAQYREVTFEAAHVPPVSSPPG